MLEISVIFEEFQLVFNFMLFFHSNTIFFSSWKMQGSKNLGGCTSPPVPLVSTGLIKEFVLNIYTKGSLHFLKISYAFYYKLVNLIHNPFVDLLRYTTILNETYCRSRKDTRLNIFPIPPLHVSFKIVLQGFSKMLRGNRLKRE